MRRLQTHYLVQRVAKVSRQVLVTFLSSYLCPLLQVAAFSAQGH
jgi:hypothetical protein